MTRKSDDAPLLPREALAPEAVAQFLRAHPDFLVENPDLIAVLTPPQFDRGERVVDMQTFMLTRLRAELAQITARERALLSAAETNVAVQARVHHAVKALLEARSFAHLIRTINDDLPAMLKIEAAVLCVETADKLSGKANATGVVVIAPGTVEKLLEGDARIMLCPDRPGENAIFGAAAERVRSLALLRLGFGAKAPSGLLALGAPEPDGFDPRQGTELLSFLAHVVEHCIRRWLHQPA